MNMLSKTVWLAIAIVALAACAPKPPDTAADAATIKADPLNWMRLYNAGDADGVAALYAEDGVLLAPGAPTVVGRAAIRSFIAAAIDSSKAAGLTFVGDEVTDAGIAGDTGWLTGTFSVRDASGATVDKGKFVTIYRRADGKWLVIRDTWNSDAPPAPAPAPAAEEAVPPPAG